MATPMHHLMLDMPAGTGALGTDCPAAGAAGRGAAVAVVACSGLSPGPNFPGAGGVRTGPDRPAADLIGTGADVPETAWDGARPAVLAVGEAPDVPTRSATAVGATFIGRAGAPCAQSDVEHPRDIAATQRSFTKVRNSSCIPLVLFGFLRACAQLAHRASSLSGRCPQSW